MKKKAEERYLLTPKGLLGLHVGLDKVDNVMDNVELFLRRNNFNAIILDEVQGFIFAKVYLEN
jgi:hypothetical protein